MRTGPLAACAFLIVLALAASPAGATTITGSFVAGTGSWTDVTNGGFETAPLSGWTGVASNGTFSDSTTAAQVGIHSAKGTATTAFSGAGFALVRTVSITPGTYVLSGFFLTSGATTGSFYLDLGDVAWEATADVNAGVSAWQFAYATFTVPEFVNDVIVRVVRDGANVQNGSFFYVDEVAITPSGSFVAPTLASAVPEPAALGLAALALLIGRRRLCAGRLSRR